MLERVYVLCTMICGGGWVRTVFVFFFSKQKTADEMRISDWSSDVCSSDLPAPRPAPHERAHRPRPSAHASTRAARPARRRAPRGRAPRSDIGRASCRERVWQYVYIQVGAVSLDKKNHINTQDHYTSRLTT